MRLLYTKKCLRQIKNSGTFPEFEVIEASEIQEEEFSEFEDLGVNSPCHIYALKRLFDKLGVLFKLSALTTACACGL